MAFNDAVAHRIRRLWPSSIAIEEKRMFGGIAFLSRGHMVCGVLDDYIVLRLGEGLAGKALGRPHVRPMDFTGQPMKSMVYLEPLAYRNARQLKAWLQQALDYNASLPSKTTLPKRKK